MHRGTRLLVYALFLVSGGTALVADHFTERGVEWDDEVYLSWEASSAVVLTE